MIVIKEMNKDYIPGDIDKEKYISKLYKFTYIQCTREDIREAIKNNGRRGRLKVIDVEENKVDINIDNITLIYEITNAGRKKVYVHLDKNDDNKFIKDFICVLLIGASFFLLLLKPLIFLIVIIFLILVLNIENIRERFF